MNQPLFHIALFEPEIPQNTGNIGRLSLGTGAMLHLIHPLGFQIDEKAVRRAGLDYWSSVQLKEHQDQYHFWKWIRNNNVRPVLFSTKAKQSYSEFSFKEGDLLLFGPETRGLPEDLFQQYDTVRIPMQSSIRSLNLSNAVAIASYALLQQINPPFFEVT